MIEPSRKSSAHSKTSQKKTTFCLTTTQGSKGPSNQVRQPGEQGKSKNRFASAAKIVLLANRAFPLPSRKASRGNSGSISIPVPQDSVSMKFAATASTVSNSVDENSSLYAVENVIVMRENTYKMQPDDLFLTEKARGIIHEVLENRLKSKSYDAEESKKLSIEISEEIKRKVKAETSVNRYKLFAWCGLARY